MSATVLYAILALALVLIVFLVAIRARGLTFALFATLLSAAIMLVLYFVGVTFITAGMG